MRIAVIGAGCGGLVTLYTLQKRLKDRNDVEIVCYDGNSQLGGEWVYHPTDEGEPNKELFCLYGSMYDNLQSNNSKAIMQIHPDFPWPDDAPSFPRRKDALKYFEAFADKFQLAKYVRFNTLVTLIERHSSDEQKFRVSCKDLRSNESSVETFDYVFMCVGQHRIPYLAGKDVFSNFKGDVLHYHDLRDPARFANKRILIVGASFGGLDLAITLANLAKSLTMTWHQRKPFWFNDEASEKVALKPQAIRAEGSTIFFDDGTSDDFDVVLFATGFKQYHPLSDELQLDFNKSPFFFPLYKHTVHPKAGNLFFVGKAYIYPIHFSRLNAEFGCAIIQRRVQLPNIDEMLVDIQRFVEHWTKQFLAMTDMLKYCPLFHMQHGLANELAVLAGVEPMPDYFIPVYYSLFGVMKTELFNYQNYQLVDDYKLANYDNGISCFKP